MISGAASSSYDRALLALSVFQGGMNRATIWKEYFENLPGIEIKNEEECVKFFGELEKWDIVSVRSDTAVHLAPEVLEDLRATARETLDSALWSSWQAAWWRYMESEALLLMSLRNGAEENDRSLYSLLAEAEAFDLKSALNWAADRGMFSKSIARLFFAAPDIWQPVAFCAHSVRLMSRLPTHLLSDAELACDIIEVIADQPDRDLLLQAVSVLERSKHYVTQSTGRSPARVKALLIRITGILGEDTLQKFTHPCLPLLRKIKWTREDPTTTLYDVTEMWKLTSSEKWMQSGTPLPRLPAAYKEVLSELMDLTIFCYEKWVSLQEERDAERGSEHNTFGRMGILCTLSGSCRLIAAGDLRGAAQGFVEALRLAQRFGDEESRRLCLGHASRLSLLAPDALVHDLIETISEELEWSQDDVARQLEGNLKSLAEV